ncbi:MULTISPECIES: 2-amino-4-hydroxy-6-hydroxymethyldihydropteridine diphosphokinase [Halomonadaceae]|uniref:2-amino-4-hydroxy-6-hydroxymethyldihydropteridine pyrophosphokinase n=1 Tax=Modicisalibacter zincidurans TaxID=1178777 RepID=A0ABP9RIT1_9GAMM|nr:MULTISPECIES: 2-amino-4-hydroxy-6-hydroxymethyldihydropteridine diphosphokinase [Halomonas]MCD6008610.1 2-amino-4-hydroxy-6-hydroxymethyldihydropteridine diphosphokinase [Halomonas sp. IOP_31]
MAAVRHTVYIGLGSNLADPVRQVEQAFDELDGLPLTRLAARSPLYRSRPVGPQDQPDFVNAVARIVTRLSPLALLDQLQALEQRHRRVRQRHWGPRTLDLDLLLFADRHWASARLTLPHPALLERAFVMIPLADIAPGLVLDGACTAQRARNFAGSDLQVLTAPGH